LSKEYNSIFRLFWVSLERGFALQQNSLITAALNSLSVYSEWVSIALFTQDEAHFGVQLCALLGNASFSEVASECLCNLASRKASSNDRRNMFFLFDHIAQLGRVFENPLCSLSTMRHVAQIVCDIGLALIAAHSNQIVSLPARFSE
jgi:hypothetical protein